METGNDFYIAGQTILPGHQCHGTGRLLIGLPDALVLAVLAGVLEAGVKMIRPLLGAAAGGARCPVISR